MTWQLCRVRRKCLTFSLTEMATITSLFALVVLFLYVFRTHATDTFFGKNEQVCEDGDCSKAPPAADDTLPATASDLHKLQAPDLHDDLLKNPKEINVIITFTNAEHNYKLQKKFQLTVSSLFQHASVPLAVHIIGDEKSQAIAEETIAKNVAKDKKKAYRMVHLNVDKLAKQLDEIVKPMQAHFSYKPGAYYNHALFFLSIAIHRVMPETMKYAIMLDADLKFMADIRELYDRFQHFSPETILGIGHDLQPVYRHMFSHYRSLNKGTKVGDPPPDGLNGFNSGVLMLDLDHMRNSKLYNSLINADQVKALTEEYKFKGHLGDQDFFSLISMKYRQLFHVLPCQWNRQLCTWWKDHGYEKVFDLYFKCEGDIKIYHGNCDTPIPES